jgi:hypothetical protein
MAASTTAAPAIVLPGATPGTMWLRDLLPARLPSARIMTYGYNARVFSSTKADVQQDGEELLDHVRAKREVIHSA